MSNRKNSSRKSVKPVGTRVRFATEQEAFWAGEFGNDYTKRNVGAQWVASNLALFAKVLARTENVRSVLELGANLGLNLCALRQLLPKAALSAVEINAQAAAELKRLGGISVHHASIFAFESPKLFDLVLIKGVLIHLNPDKLPQVYDLMHAASARYICVAEYYNPTPVAIPYRGHNDRLFKRDFAGELLKRHSDLRLEDYGFAYHGDANYPQDDLTWFLLEKAVRPKPRKG
jgi:spore coat polysaccharide biosynthesis protein SpsF